MELGTPGRTAHAAARALAAVALLGCGAPGERVQVYFGTIEAVQVDVAPEVGGRILERSVDQGDRVEVGQVVARIDPERYRHALAETEAALRESRAGRDLLRAGYRAEQVEAAARALDEARAHFTLAEAQRRRAQRLFADQVTALAELDRTQRDVDVAGAHQASAEQRYRMLRRGYRAEEIEQAAAAVERLEARLAQRRLELDRTTVRSPLAGTVTEKIQEPGEYARPGAPIVAVADLVHLYVWVYVNAVEQGGLRLNDEVSVRVDAHPGRTFPGRVVYVAPQAEFTPRNVQTAEDRVQLVFGVKVAVEDPDGALKVGLPADVAWTRPPGAAAAR